MIFVDYNHGSVKTNVNDKNNFMGAARIRSKEVINKDFIAVKR